MLDKIIVLGRGAKTALAAAALPRVSGDRRAFDVTALGNGDAPRLRRRSDPRWKTRRRRRRSRCGARRQTLSLTSSSSLVITRRRKLRWPRISSSSAISLMICRRIRRRSSAVREPTGDATADRGSPAPACRKIRAAPSPFSVSADTWRTAHSPECPSRSSPRWSLPVAPVSHCRASSTERELRINVMM